MDEAAKKHLLRTVPYGLYAATTQGPDGQPHAFLLSWFTQTSFDPPLVVLGVHKESRAYEHLTARPDAPVAINFLASDQKPLGQELLKKPSFEDGEVAGTRYEPGKNGCMLLPETLGALEAEFVTEADVEGDHAVLVCRVTEAHRFNDGEPLTHENTGWHYGG